MLMHVLVTALMLVAEQQPATQQPPAGTARPPAAGQTAPAPATTPAARPPAPAPRPTTPPANLTVEIRVTDRSGSPVTGAQVTAEGPVARDGKTDARGIVTFRTLSAGTYRLRAEQDGFITLEKEVALRAGAPTSAEMSLSAGKVMPAPAPVPEPAPAVAKAPPPPPAPVMPTGARGETKILSMTDLAEKSLGGRDNMKVVQVGCNSLSNARLIVIRETLPAGGYSDADEALYLMAGEATIIIDGKQQPMTAGWYAMLPRGTNFEVVRKGRNPAILLSQLNGRPCGEPTQAKK